MLSRRKGKMCDYSLMSLPNRLAVCGEELVVHRFELGAIGLAPISEVKTPETIDMAAPKGFIERLRRSLFPPPRRQCTAVCLPPGARLLLRDIPEKLQRALGLETDVEEVVFTEIGTSGFRDAVRFESGTELLLQRLTEGQRVEVLALSSFEREQPTDELRQGLASSRAF
jgi:hypothetical protein